MIFWLVELDRDKMCTFQVSFFSESRGKLLPPFSVGHLSVAVKKYLGKYLNEECFILIHRFRNFSSLSFGEPDFIPVASRNVVVEGKVEENVITVRVERDKKGTKNHVYSFMHKPNNLSPSTWPHFLIAYSARNGSIKSQSMNSVLLWLNFHLSDTS